MATLAQINDGLSCWGSRCPLLIFCSIQGCTTFRLIFYTRFVDASCVPARLIFVATFFVSFAFFLYSLHNTFGINERGPGSHHISTIWHSVIWADELLFVFSLSASFKVCRDCFAWKDAHGGVKKARNWVFVAPLACVLLIWINELY